MVDATGKPNAGIERGSFYFVGSYDECYMAKPEIHKGDVIGGKEYPRTRTFDPRFCRVDITIPTNLIDSLGVVRCKLKVTFLNSHLQDFVRSILVFLDPKNKCKLL